MKIKKIFILLIILVFILDFTKSYAIEDEPNIIANSAILIDSSSEKILYSKNAHQKSYPASTTKIVTAIIAIENCNLDDIVTVPYEAISSIPSGYSIADLKAGEQLTVEQILKLMLVYSANDAANVIAYHISGSIDAFSTLMNDKVSELKLENTHFVNPSGIHDENHYSTAYDLAIIMKYCMNNSTFRSLSKLKYCKIPPTNKYNEERVFNTTNELLLSDNRNVASNYYYKYAIAGKTGYTTKAKNCLVSVSNKDGFELICVVLSTGLYPNNLSGRFIDTKTLFEYGYNNYIIKKIREKNAIATQINIAEATKETEDLDLLLSDDIVAVIAQDDINTDFSSEIEITKNYSAPIAQGEIIGKITYNIDGIEYSTNLIASHDVERDNSFTLVIRLFLLIVILYFLYKLLSSTQKQKKNGFKFKKSNKNI